MSLSNISATSRFVNPFKAIEANAANAVVCAVAGLESEGIALANTIAGAASGIVNGVITKAENIAIGAISSAVNSVTGLLVADATAIANGVSSRIGSLFTDTLAGIGVDVKLPIPDALASSFGQRLPQSTMFATNSILSQAEAVTFGAARTIANIINLPTLLERYALSAVASLNREIMSEIKQLSMTGLYGNSSLGYRTSQSLSCPTAAYEGHGASYAGYTDYATLSGPVARDLTGANNGLISFFNPYIPTVTDSFGNPYSGLPNNISATTLNQITNTLRGTFNLANITIQAIPYAAQQSLFDGLYAVSATLGLVVVLEQMALSPLYFRDTTATQARALISQSLLNPRLTYTLIAAAGPSSVSLPDGWTTTLVTNPALTAADVSIVTSVLTQTHTSITNIFSTHAPVAAGTTAASYPGGGSGVGIPGPGGTTLPIWNTPVLSNTPVAVAQGLLTTSTATFEGATTSGLSTVGLPHAATIALLARGTVRTLTLDGNFDPVSAKGARVVLYNNLLNAA